MARPSLPTHHDAVLHHHHATDEELQRLLSVDDRLIGEEKFAAFWSACDESAQSDVIVAATSRVTGYLDSWPHLEDTWTPRFEEAIGARLGRLSLSGRVDLLLGRPRGDGRQTMLIADWKSGNLNDDHYREAAFYALLTTLRFGVPPFRSTIYSLATGEWTDPDVTEEMLWGAVADVTTVAESLVATHTDQRPPTTTAGRHCDWCPLSATCPAAAALREADVA